MRIHRGTESRPKTVLQDVTAWERMIIIENLDMQPHMIDMALMSIGHCHGCVVFLKLSSFIISDIVYRETGTVVNFS